jgi:integrase
MKRARALRASEGPWSEGVADPHRCRDEALLLWLGVPPHIVQVIVGHVDIHASMTIYAHASLEDQRKALDQFAERSAGQTMRRA